MVVAAVAAAAVAADCRGRGRGGRGGGGGGGRGVGGGGWLSQLPLIVGVRHLVDSLFVCVANMLLLLVAIGLVIGELVDHGRPNDTETAVWPDTVSFTVLFGAATNIVCVATP